MNIGIRNNCNFNGILKVYDSCTRKFEEFNTEYIEDVGINCDLPSITYGLPGKETKTYLLMGYAPEVVLSAYAAANSSDKSRVSLKSYNSACYVS